MQGIKQRENIIIRNKKDSSYAFAADMRFCITLQSRDQYLISHVRYIVKRKWDLMSCKSWVFWTFLIPVG